MPQHPTHLLTRMHRDLFSLWPHLVCVAFARCEPSLRQCESPRSFAASPLLTSGLLCYRPCRAVGALAGFRTQQRDVRSLSYRMFLQVWYGTLRQDQRRLRYRVFPLLRVAAHHGRNPLLWLVVPVPGAFSIICPAELLVPALYSEEATASEPAVVSRWCRSCRAMFRMRNRYIEAVAEKDCERVAWFDREFDEFLRRMSEWRAPPPGLGTATHLTSLD